MAFQMKAKESIREGITRNVSREIEKALDYLGAEAKSPRNNEGENEAVHEVRKSFKKVRATLRLLRGELGSEFYHKENFAFRDAARPLTTVRDAEMLVEVWEKLRVNTKDPNSRIEKEIYTRVREALLANRKEANKRVLEKGRALVAVEKFAAAALKRVAGWTIERNEWEALESGLRRVYRAGYRARALAEENPSMENLHEWRKQSKYLWHQLQLLESAWAPHEKELGEQFHALSTLLGDDHDLGVLRQTLAADPLSYGGHAALKAPVVILDRRRQELQRQAFALGGKIYKDVPKVFVSRIQRYWNDWKIVVGPAKVLSGGRSTPRGPLSSRMQKEAR